MPRVALLGWCATLAAAAAQPADVERAFRQFLLDYGKNYAGAERDARFRAFASNYALVQAENAKGHFYELGINEFADQTPEEFALTHLGLRETDRPWGGLPYLGRHQRGNSTLPSEVDWTKQGAVTPVKNQAQCGSCWAFSTTGALEGAWKVAGGQLVSLSEQQLVDCSGSFGNQGCSGGLMDSAFKYAEANTMCTEASYPYEAKNGICRASGCTAAIPHGGVVGYKDVAHDDEQALMEAVAQQPVSIAIEADRSVFQLYKSGILSGTCGTSLDHGVLVVGFGTEDGKDYWLVKNSWGAGWGLQGYVKLLRGKAGAGECGLKSEPSYPVVKASLAAAVKAANHYEKPPCQQDEVAAEVQGASGAVCAPHCDSTACPTDVPAGTTAKPQCVLQDSASGQKYCALVCSQSSGCPQGSTCALVGGSMGICVYPEQEGHENLPSLAVSGQLISV